jgi:hypothetical protein
MNNPQLSASQLQNTAQQPHVASPAQPINYAPTTFQQPTQPMPQNPVLQPLTQPQPQPQPQTEQEHIKIQTGQHSNQAEDMIIIDR